MVEDSRLYEMYTDHSHSQRRDIDATMAFCQAVAILPDGIQKLWRMHSDLRECHTVPSRYVLDDDMNPGIQTKYETIVDSVEHKVTAGQKHLARGGDSYSILNH